MFIGIDSLYEEKFVLPFAQLDSVYGKAYKSIPLNDSVFMGVGIRRRENSEDYGLMMFYSKDGEELGYNDLYTILSPGIARQAITALLKGSTHANVYKWLEKKRRELKRGEIPDL